VDSTNFLASWSLRSSMVDRTGQLGSIRHIVCTRVKFSDADGPLLNGFDLVRVRLFLCSHCFTVCCVCLMSVVNVINPAILADKSNRA